MDFTESNKQKTEVLANAKRILEASDLVYIHGSYVPKDAATMEGALLRLYVYPWKEPHADFVEKFHEWLASSVLVKRYGCRPPERHQFNRWIDCFEPVRVRIYLANPGMIISGQIDGIQFDEIEVDDELSVIEKALNKVRRFPL